MLIARWIDQSTVDCLYEDGIRDYTSGEFCQLASLDVLADRDSLPALKTKIEAYIRELYEEEDLPLFRWEEDDSGLTLWDDGHPNNEPDVLAVVILTEAKPTV